METDATLKKLGDDYNAAKEKGDTAGMERAHQQAEDYRKSKNPGYGGSADGSSFTFNKSGGSDTELSYSSYNPIETIPEYSIATSSAIAEPFLNIGSAITVATDGFKVATAKFFDLVLFWLPWAFLAVFFVRIVKSKAKVKAGPITASAGQ